MIFFIYIGALFIVILIAMGILWKRLSEFQNTYEQNEFTRERIEDEKRAPQLTFDKYIEGVSAQSLAELWLDNHPGTLDTKETVTAFYEELMTSSETPV